MVSITSSTPVVSILPLRILLLAHATHALLYVPHPQSSPRSGTSISSSLRVPVTLPRTRGTEHSFLRQCNGGTRMEMSSASSNKKRARGSPNHDPSSLSRERFVAAAVAVGSASGIISKLRVDPSYDITHERIFDTRRRSFLPAEPEQFLGRGFNNRVVCLGETHTHPLHHRMQFNVMKATYAVTKARGEPFSIGLEMFYRQQQGSLDRYVFNHGDLRLLKAETKWDQTWGFDFNQYAKIFRYAREHGIRLVGLNAPASLLNLVNKVGVDGLPQQIKDVMPDMDLGQEKHRKRFEETISGFQHGRDIDEAQMTRMYQAQTLWDEYMAETASKYIKSAGGVWFSSPGTGMYKRATESPTELNAEQV